MAKKGWKIKNESHVEFVTTKIYMLRQEELHIQGMKYVATFKNIVVKLSSKASTTRQGNCVAIAADCVATIRTRS